MADYTYLLTDTNDDQLLEHLLQSEVEGDGGIAPTCTSVGRINATQFKVYFDSALSGGEQTTLTGIVNAHNGTVSSVDSTATVSSNIQDINGNEAIIINPTASAVNEFTASNATTGNDPTFSASGDDTNIGIDLIPKGSGTVKIDGVDAVTTSGTQTLTNKSIDAGQLTGTVADARIGASNVTQHVASIDHDSLLNFTQGEHRIINDSGTSATELWSASKIDTELGNKINTSELGANNGVATLDGSGKLTSSQIPLELMSFKGNWNASTNSPTLVDGTGDTGDTYRISVAGTQDLGSGSLTYEVGDWVYYDGADWLKGDNIDQVTSVNSQTGVVVLDTGDISTVTDKNYVTDTQLTNIGNLSGTNTGDEVSATTSTEGIVELATQVEVDAGTDTTRVVTPATLENNDKWATKADSSHTHDTSDVTSGTFADARISSSSVTQHVGSIDHDSLLNFTQTEHRIINDAGTSSTELWSASKIDTEVGGKSPDLYDAVVPDDYSLPSGAFTAGAKSVFVRTGTYTETSNVVIPDGGRLVGEELGVTIEFSGAFGVVADGNSGTKETTGTITFTNASTAVTGSGTTFTNLSGGDYIALGAVFYKIASVTDATNIVLSRTYRGKTRSGFPMFGQSMFNDISIENIVIKNSTGTGLYLRGVRNSSLNNVHIHSCTDNFQIIDSGNSVFNSMVSCNATGTGTGVDVLSSRSIQFESFHAYNNLGHGVDVASSSLAIKFNGCEFDSNGGAGINVTGSATDVIITDCGSKNNKGKGINTDSGTIRCIVSDSTIEFNDDVGVDFDGTQNVVSNCQIGNNPTGMFAGAKGIVTGNHIHDNAGVGLNLNGDTDTSVTGNVIADNTSHGIEFTGTNDDVTLAGNTVTGNGGDGIKIASSVARALLVGNNVYDNTGTEINDLSSTTEYGITDSDVASTTAQGIVELATQSEVDTGTDTTRAVTPATLANYSGLGGSADVNATTYDASDEVTTTSNTYVAVGSGMSVTPGAGDYYVMATISIENSSTNSDVFVKLSANGTDVSNSEVRRDFKTANVRGSLTLMGSVTGLGAGQTIDVMWKTVAGTSPEAKAYTRHLVVFKTG